MDLLLRGYLLLAHQLTTLVRRRLLICPNLCWVAWRVPCDCVAARKAQAGGSEAAGGARRDCRAGIVADAYERLPAAGGDRRQELWRSTALGTTEHEGPLGRKPGPQVPALSASYVPDFRRERIIFEQNGRPGRAPNGSHQAQRHAECENLYGSGL